MKKLKDYLKNGEAVEKFVVYNIENNAPSVIHETREEAIKEVERIYQNGFYNQKPLIIMQITDIFVPNLFQYKKEEDLPAKIYPVLSEEVFKENPEEKQKRANKLSDFLLSIEPSNPNEKAFLDGILKSFKSKGSVTIGVVKNYSDGYMTEIDGTSVSVWSKEEFHYIDKWFGQFPSVLAQIYNYQLVKTDLLLNISVQDLDKDLYYINDLLNKVKKFDKFNFYIMKNYKNKKEIEVDIENPLDGTIPLISFYTLSPAYVLFLIYTIIDKLELGFDITKVKYDVAEIKKITYLINGDKKPVRIAGRI